jgi:small subunit ribosomal protein S4
MALITQGVSALARVVPGYLSLDAEKLSATFVRMPDDISSVPYPFEADLNLIIELYSR